MSENLAGVWRVKVIWYLCNRTTVRSGAKTGLPIENLTQRCPIRRLSAHTDVPHRESIFILWMHLLYVILQSETSEGGWCVRN